jgi:hypothetical protein
MLAIESKSSIMVTMISIDIAADFAMFIVYKILLIKPIR